MTCTRTGIRAYNVTSRRNAPCTTSASGRWGHKDGVWRSGRWEKITLKNDRKKKIRMRTFHLNLSLISPFVGAGVFFSRISYLIHSPSFFPLVCPCLPEAEVRHLAFRHDVMPVGAYVPTCACHARNRETKCLSVHANFHSKECVTRGHFLAP